MSVELVMAGRLEPRGAGLGFRLERANGDARLIIKTMMGEIESEAGEYEFSLKYREAERDLWFAEHGDSWRAKYDAGELGHDKFTPGTPVHAAYRKALKILRCFADSRGDK